MANDFFYSKPVPMHSKQIDPVPRWEVERLEKQEALLKRAMEGEEEALRTVREKLLYWERRGRVILERRNGN